MQLFRICPESYLENYSGLGGSYLNGGRWNQPGQPVLYFALSAAVAMLEMANYLPSPRLVPKTYRLGIYQLSDTLITDYNFALPENWAFYPYPALTQQPGSSWLRSKANLALKLPSAAIPGGLGSIALVNTLHPAISQLRLVDIKQQLFNDRAFLGL